MVSSNEKNGLDSFVSDDETITIGKNVQPKASRRQAEDAGFRDEIGQERGRMDRRANPVHPSHETEMHDAIPVHPEEFDFSGQGLNLVAPPPRAGYRQKWIRAELAGQADGLNYGKFVRPGFWQPRPANTLPADQRLPTKAVDIYGDVICVRGMILCELPMAVYRKRKEFVEGRTQALSDSVDKHVRGTVNGLHQTRKTTVSVGRRNIDVAPDSD